MTLQDIIKGVLAELHRPTDTATVEQWRERLTLYANEAVADLTAAFRPWRRDEVTLAGHVVNITSLSARCLKVLALELNGQRLPYYYGAGLNTLCVPGQKDGRPWISYRYCPKELVALTDVPELPAQCHPLIVTYVAARERVNFDAGSQSGAKLNFSLYETQKRRVKSDLGEPDGHRLYNRY
ncbi:MAG: hypothetical protein FWE69_02960 [Clostridiales bacterium]|nr:hypothetical protein [Clostridiales bacterium]